MSYSKTTCLYSLSPSVPNILATLSYVTPGVWETGPEQPDITYANSFEFSRCIHLPSSLQKAYLEDIASPPAHHPQSLSLHLRVIFAPRKNLCLCSNMEVIFLICFAIPDEYFYLHLCYRAAGYCLKLNHKVTAFLPPTRAQNLGSTVNSFVFFTSSVILATRPLH